MKYVIHDHRFAKNLFENDPKFSSLYDEVINVIENINDDDLIDNYEHIERENKKSLSQTINKLISDKLVANGWNAESAIFSDPRYAKGQDQKRWRVDFAKDEITIEVAFNHGEAIAWNLIKPVLASELNHVAKEIQTRAGIIICVTDKMKKAGNFDGAVGSYEKFLRYLAPLQNILVSPILIIGLLPPDSFHIDKKTKQVVRNKL